MILLSGIGGVVTTKAVDVGPITLQGTIHGVYGSRKLAGAPTTFHGNGAVSPLGHVSVHGSLQVTTAVPMGTETLSAGRKGNIFLQETLVGETNTAAGSSVNIEYTISGGTGRFKNASGSGISTVTFSPNSRDPLRGTFNGTLGTPPLV